MSTIGVLVEILAVTSRLHSAGLARGPARADDRLGK